MVSELFLLCFFDWVRWREALSNGLGDQRSLHFSPRAEGRRVSGGRTRGGRPPLGDVNCLSVTWKTCSGLPGREEAGPHYCILKRWPCCVTLGESLNISEPPVSHL